MKSYAVPSAMLDFPGSDQYIPILPYSTITLPAPAASTPVPEVITEDSKLQKIDFSTLSRPEIAQQLKWQVAEDSHNFCGGYYTEPVLYYPEELATEGKELPVRITFDESTLSQHGVSALAGNVVITQPNRQIISDLTHLYRNEQGEFTTVDLFGHVDLREPGRQIIGETGHANLIDNSGVISNAIYRMTFRSLAVDTEAAFNNEKAYIRVEDLSAWGHAKEIQHDASGILHIKKGTYTTCPPLTDTWMVKASEVTLNNDTGRGTAEHLRFYVKDVPVLYLPYFVFPLDDRRQTGFLFPIYGHSEESGYELALPFYWNIAPNYDATLTPNVMTLRGLQFNGEFRYLTEQSYGNVHGSFLPDDKAFKNFREEQLEQNRPGTPGYNRLKDDSDNRGFLSWRDNHNYNPNWSSYLYLNRVTDDYYFIDFDNDPAQLTDFQITNEAALFYNDQHWNFAGRLQGFQTLHPINHAIISNQYRKLPEIILNGNYPDGPYNSIFTVNNSFEYFDKLRTPGIPVDPVTGARMNINPGVTLPFFWLSGYINPQLQFAATRYDLHNQLPWQDNSITRTLPIFNIDFGLFFDRDVTALNRQYQQTLEPRLFYLYVPYRNQDDIPIFDTSLQPFSYSQLFRTNRFTGLDRIGDANQLSVSVTTRFLTQDSGEEKLRASIGQILYFADRIINVNPPVNPLNNTIVLPSEIVMRAITLPSNTPTSPLVGEVNYQLLQNWRFLTGIAWDPNTNITNNANMSLQYKSDKNHIINIGLNYLRGGDPDTFFKIQSSKNDLNQSDVSIIWPINEKISGLARWNYNISHGYTQSTFAGIQYEGCCFAVRLVGGRDLRIQEVNTRHKNSHAVFDNRIFLEFVLKGLGTITPESANRVLTDGIMGYEETLSVF